MITQLRIKNASFNFLLKIKLILSQTKERTSDLLTLITN